MLQTKFHSTSSRDLLKILSQVGVSPDKSYRISPSVLCSKLQMCQDIYIIQQKNHLNYVI